MTTNVFDLASSTMTSDSRWSWYIPGKDFILYVDDTGFDKIVTYKNLSFVFAGSSAVIQAWKDWLATNPGPDAVLPATSGQGGSIAVLMAAETDGRCVPCFAYGQEIKKADASFAGSGALFAHLCWMANKCAHKAVKTAKDWDPFSGGEVKHVRICSNTDTNATNTAHLREINAQAVKKGMVMYTNKSRQPMSVEIAAANDPEVKALMNDIAKGEIVPQAPCDCMVQPWPEEEREKLSIAFSSALRM